MRGHVDRLLVAELPFPGGAGQVARLPGVLPVVVTAPHAVLEAGEHLAQRGVAEPANGLRREFELAAVTAQVALPLQLPLEPAQRLQVIDRLPAERAADRFLVDVLHAGTWVILAERGLQVGEVRHFRDRARRVAEAERLTAGHPDSALRLAKLGPAGPQRVAERGQLRREAGVLHRLGHQVRQFLALLVGQ